MENVKRRWFYSSVSEGLPLFEFRVFAAHHVESLLIIRMEKSTIVHMYRVGGKGVRRFAYCMVKITRDGDGPPPRVGDYKTQVGQATV
ncbi:MAG: hypothetical protein LUC93_16190 [Planctomycetaceae bacterium]|nr:hypothetical protein [Planctomycetaceae bacterium]